MAREFFNAYHSYLKSLDPLNDAERGRLFTALLEYSATGAIPDLRGNERFIFPMMKEQIDRDTEKYDAKCAANKRNIDIRWNTNVYERIRTDTNGYEKYQGKGEGKDKGKGKGKGKGDKQRAGAFTPPSLQDVEDYCRERGNRVDAKKFYDYFTEGNWTDAKGQKVKNWKQKVLTWEKYSGGDTDVRDRASNGTGEYHLQYDT